MPFIHSKLQMLAQHMFVSNKGHNVTVTEGGTADMSGRLQYINVSYAISVCAVCYITSGDESNHVSHARLSYPANAVDFEAVLWCTVQQLMLAVNMTGCFFHYA